MISCYHETVTLEIQFPDVSDLLAVVTGHELSLLVSYDELGCHTDLTDVLGVLPAGCLLGIV